jgi:AraC-type DNA-binding domain-containing proteins
MKERVFLEEFESIYFFHGSTQNWYMESFHFHKQYEIILFLSDGATLEIDDRVYNVKKGDLFLINNKEYHRTNGSVGKMHSRYVLMFDPDILDNISEVFKYDFEKYFERRPEGFVHRIRLVDENLREIEQLMSKIEKNMSEGRNNCIKIKLKLAILELIVATNEMYEFFSKDNAVEKSNETNNISGVEQKSIKFKEPILYRERIEEIKKYIVNNIENKIDLDELAIEFYLSRFYLCRYFKKETGFTVVQYIMNQKIVAAKVLLKKGLTVTEVAERLAYNSDSHFISVFRKMTGTTPKQYAKNKRDV